jgi:hypothetical protein
VKTTKLMSYVVGVGGRAEQSALDPLLVVPGKSSFY